MRAPALVTGGGPALLVLAALFPGLRPLVALALVVGWVAFRLLGRREALAWAATLPVAVPLVWPWVLGSDLPLGWASVFQGLVFGIVHAGPEVVALLPLHIALLSAVGIAAGIARWRFGSLWVPIGIHVGADIALYVGLAGRPAA